MGPDQILLLAEDSSYALQLQAGTRELTKNVQAYVYQTVLQMDWPHCSSMFNWLFECQQFIFL